MIVVAVLMLWVILAHRGELLLRQIECRARRAPFNKYLGQIPLSIPWICPMIKVGRRECECTVLCLRASEENVGRQPYKGKFRDQKVPALGTYLIAQSRKPCAEGGKGEYE